MPRDSPFRTPPDSSLPELVVPPDELVVPPPSLPPPFLSRRATAAFRALGFDGPVPLPVAEAAFTAWLGWLDGFPPAAGPRASAAREAMAAAIAAIRERR